MFLFDKICTNHLNLRNNQKRIAWDLCERLNKSLSGEEIYEACDFVVRGGKPLW